MKKKILIIEDNEDIRILYKRMLRKEKMIEISAVESGEEALKIIPDLKPDLLFVDISLPGISGLELTRKMRQEYPSVKILVVTGHEVIRYYDEAINSGADDLVSKEIGKDILIKCRKLLQIQD